MVLIVSHNPSSVAMRFPHQRRPLHANRLLIPQRPIAGGPRPAVVIHHPRDIIRQSTFIAPATRKDRAQRQLLENRKMNGAMDSVSGYPPVTFVLAFAGPALTLMLAISYGLVRAGSA